MKLLFIHLARTGGTSIRRMLNKLKKDVDYDCIHNKFLIRKELDKVTRTRDFVIDYSQYGLVSFFVRNPYERLISCYDYFRKGGLNQYPGQFFDHDEKRQKRILEEFPNFEQCCNNLENFCDIVRHANPMSSSLPEIPKGTPVFQGRYENFENDVTELLDNLRVPITKDDILSVNATKGQAELIYTDDMKDAVYNFYKEDFENFGYKK